QRDPRTIRVHVRTDADPRDQVSHELPRKRRTGPYGPVRPRLVCTPRWPRRVRRVPLVSGAEDFVEQRFSLVLVCLLGQGQFTDQDLPGLGQHPLFPGRKAAFLIAPPEVTDYFGNFIHIAGGKLLEIGLIPAGPVSWLLGIRCAQHLEDPLQPFLPDDVPHAYKLGVVGGNAHRQVALIDLEHEVGFLLTLDRTGLDLLDPSSPMVGVDDSVADLESHVACTPSAVAMLPRRTRSISRPSWHTRRSVAHFWRLKLTLNAPGEVRGWLPSPWGPRPGLGDAYWRKRGHSPRGARE